MTPPRHLCRLGIADRAGKPLRGLAITARGLTRAFGDATVLRQLDLDVPAGQFLALVGRSGSGKSTLLRLLSGLDRPSAGRVSLGGATEEGGAGAGARIMFQEPRLLPWARVLANVAVGLGAEPSPRARDLSFDALRDVGLESRAGDWPSILSGGQKQRVALARALVSRPRFLALDEPLGALDALTRIEMQRLIEHVWRRDGFTAVLVTHDVSEALALGDRVVLIEDGAVALDLAVPLPRPRGRGTPAFAALEDRLLRRLIGDGPRTKEPVPAALGAASADGSPPRRER